jgi:Asp-tRNA(Asn)/Glu-tRNA(Gln) amidotransferase A subunit family amidase
MSDYFVIGPMARYAEDLHEMFKVLTKPSAKRPELKLEEPVDPSKLKFYYFESTGDPCVHDTDGDMRGALKTVVEHLQSCYGVNVQKVRNL